MIGIRLVQWLNDSFDFLAKIDVEHGGIGDARVRNQQVLNFSRVDVHAAIALPKALTVRVERVKGS